MAFTGSEMSGSCSCPRADGSIFCSIPRTVCHIGLDMYSCARAGFDWIAVMSWVTVPVMAWDMAPETCSCTEAAAPSMTPCMMEPALWSIEDWNSSTRAMSRLLYMYAPVAETLGK